MRNCLIRRGRAIWTGETISDGGCGMQDKTNLKHFLCPKTYILIEIIAQKTALFRLVSYCFEEECSPSESLRFTCESWQAGRHQFHYIFEFRVPGTDLLLPLKATPRLDSRCLSTRGGSALIGFRPEADPPWAKTAFQNIILGTDLLLPLKATIRPEVLNYRVRDGIGCVHFARDTRNNILKSTQKLERDSVWDQV